MCKINKEVEIMELRTSISFIGTEDVLSKIDYLINEESLIDDMVYSLDFISELETEDTYVYRCYSTGDSWVNIYDIHSRFSTNGIDKCDIIYTSIDSETYVDVISLSGNFDAYVDCDPEKIQEICETYGLEFFGSDEPEEEYDDDEEEGYY